MTRYFAFNGDADGLCALQQLRLTEPGDSTLVTGVKRDIALLNRVSATAGDEVSVLDVSLDVNRDPLLALLKAGVRVRYFDHHYAGEVPDHPGLETHLDPSPTVCTSLLVDQFLGGKARAWGLVGAFGDGLSKEASALAGDLGLDAAARSLLQEMGVRLNYNAYGEAVADLHVPPAELAQHMLEYPDPQEFGRRSDLYRRLSDGYESDMEEARKLEPARRVPGAMMLVLPNAPWARRAIGALANDLMRDNPDSAIAILSPKKEGGYVVSIRVFAGASVGADTFCRRFPTGGGRRTAAGINHLPQSDLDRFAGDFEQQFGTAGA